MPIWRARAWKRESSVANTIMPIDVNLPPGPTRVVMTFRFMNGNLVRDYKTGDVIR